MEAANSTESNRSNDNRFFETDSGRVVNLMLILSFRSFERVLDLLGLCQNTVTSSHSRRARKPVLIW